MADIKSESIDRLFSVLASLKSNEEYYAFFDDLCTVKELKDMAQRLDTAILLSQGKSYQQITGEMGISTATISRVNRCLEYGSGGYRNALELLKKQ